MLVTSAKVNAVYREIVDFTKLTTLFTNEFGCAPGDCHIALLPPKIIDKTPSGCFNLSTTTGMGNANTAGNSVATTTVSTATYVSGFGASEIVDSNAKRTCAFYEMQAFEPSGFGGSITAKKHDFNSILGVQNANAIGIGKLNITNNPVVTANIAAQTAPLNTQITNNNTAITNTINTFNANLPALNNGLSSGGFAYSNFQTMSSSTDTSTLFNLQNICNIGQSSFDKCITSNYGGTSSAGYTTNMFSCDSSTGQVSAQVLQGLNQCQCSSPNSCSNCASGYCYAGFYNSFYVSVSPQSQLVISKKADNISLNNQIISLNISLNNPNNFISLAIQTATNPLVNALKNYAMWDIRTVGSMSATGFYPFEAGKIPAAQNKLLFIARDLSINYIGAELTGVNTAAVTADIPAFSSAFTLKLDQKFDDGKPYSGNIIAGQNISNNTAANGKGCTNMTTAFASMTATDLTASYNKTINLANGCVVGAVINA